MDQTLIEGLQHLQLTKEEEEDIAISVMSRLDLIEECTLSLFGRLLADRNQNLRALKSTLRSAWKLGSDLRIIDVGSNIFQFKFCSKYQMEWVEKNGPWNFDNNLLLLCRWRKGLSISNLTFTHSPFWIQIWGLPFENMTEEVGRDLRNRLGNYIETDKHTWLSEQAKFMRIRADLPIEKPLRRGGHVVNPEGKKFWVTFKYERLPNFCFRCGVLGHDEKHCPNTSTDNSDSPRQYGDWLRANGNSKWGVDKPKASNSRDLEEKRGEESDDRSTPATTTSMDPMTGRTEFPEAPKGLSNSKNTVSDRGGMSDKQCAIFKL